jgi:hypothetical protein
MRPKQTRELHQRPVLTSVQLVHTEMIRTWQSMALAQQAQRKIDLMPWLPDNTPNEARHDMNSEPAGHAPSGGDFLARRSTEIRHSPKEA